MNAVEIEQAITDLAEQPFDPAEFPYAFLEAFGNKATTIKRLRAGASNKSDLGGVLQTSNIHILTCDAGRVTHTLAALKASPATVKAKAKFILATDGVDFEAEDLTSGETVACAFKDFPAHFGFFLPLAGISPVRQISEHDFGIRATLSEPACTAEGAVCQKEYATLMTCDATGSPHLVHCTREGRCTAPGGEERCVWNAPACEDPCAE